MKLLMSFFVIFIISIILLNNWVAFGQTPTDAPKLSVTFVNNVSPNYDVTLDPNEKFILSQSYSWVRDPNSRYNLISYSMDDSEFIPISRLPRGSFTLDIPTDSSNSIVFLATIQFPISVDGAKTYSFLPESPTNDNWFDVDSKISISVPKIIKIDEKSRKLISGWSFDKADMKPITEDSSEFFITPSMQISDVHTVDFSSTNQYYLDVISQYGSTQGSGWYNEGSVARINVSQEGFGNEFEGWTGQNVETNEQFAQVTVNSPLTVKAKWGQNYLAIVVSIVIPVSAIAAFFAIRTKRTTKKPSPQKIESSEQEIENYYNELKEYTKQKALEKLDLMFTSEIITKTKHFRLREKITD